MEEEEYPDIQPMLFATACKRGESEDVKRLFPFLDEICHRAGFICAIKTNQFGIITWLLENGVKSRRFDNNPAVLKLLLSHGFYVRNVYLHDIESNGLSVECAKILLDAGAIPDRKTLERAVIDDNRPMVRLLMRYGANPYLFPFDIRRTIDQLYGPRKDLIRHMISIQLLISYLPLCYRDILRHMFTVYFIHF